MSCPRRLHRKAALTLLALGLLTASAGAMLPPWMQHLAGASSAEVALLRLMHLPGVDVLYPRPPREAQEQLGTLLQAKPDDAALYALRAHADEAALDEQAAERDWKQAAEHSKDTVAGKLQLAAFYGRRLDTAKEIRTLTEAAQGPSLPSEKFVAADRQRAWKTFDRLLYLEVTQAAPPAQTAATYDAFLARYPKETAVYARTLAWLLSEKSYAAGEALVAHYEHGPNADESFALRAHAEIDLERDGPVKAMAVYDRAFQPLWPAKLVAAYYTLLAQQHRQRAMVDEARATLAAHPTGPEALNALARIFYFDQQAGRLDRAQATLDRFRVERDRADAASGKSTWTPEDLHTLARLTEATHSYGEAARYNYALAAMPGSLPAGEPAAQDGLAGLVGVLLAAPGQPLPLGAESLSLYKDIATLDQGPGYGNGILSLWLNGTSISSGYAAENGKAQSYFHRSKAAELLAELDRRFPAAPERAALHAQLITAEAAYGDPAAVIAAAKQYLADFPAGAQPGAYNAGRAVVAGLLADAYARENDTAREFALYDSLLGELAAQSEGQPLTAAGEPERGAWGSDGSDQPDAEGVAQSAADSDSSSRTPVYAVLLTAYPPARPTLPAAVEYRELLDRYLARLVAQKQLPQALHLLRRELDRSPDDPRLYERLASFLQQNNLSAQQEEVYKLAAAHFNEPTYYDKLARLYLRERKREDFAALTRQVVDIFSGTELDGYFGQVVPSAAQEAGPQLALQLNVYAAKRFPHDLVFTRNLLAAYSAKPTANPTAYEALLRQQWFAADDLRDAFFALLSRTGKLSAEIAQLQQMAGAGEAAGVTGASDPAAMHELAEADLWTSHFEQAAAPLGELAAVYPADAGMDDRAVSLFRSLSYLDPSDRSLERAVTIEKNLLAAEPDSADRLATLGDLDAEATATGGEDLRAATPFWLRIPQLHPGSAEGYLASATIFWDYFQFDEALGQIEAARTRFSNGALFAYEAGALEENRQDLAAAVEEYTLAVLHPLPVNLQVDSAVGFVQAAVNAPSDAADSDLRSTLQSLVGSPEAHARLLELSTRPAARALVDAASAKAQAAAPADRAALTLRADVLVAQHREPELAPLLSDAVAKATTQVDARDIGALAQAHMLVPVYEEALARQAALTPDAVERIELEYSEARSLEGRKQIAAAQRMMANVYAANPRILGVVRATVDFDARTHKPKLAIGTLLDAARVATPKLARDFTLEAASRANDSGDPGQARTLALGLLATTPYDPQATALVAASYSRENDNAGLKSFYLAQLERARTDPALTPDARRQDVVVLRRGLIPALTRLNDFGGGEDQYLALVSAFPSDAGTAGQAALYAQAHDRQAQLVDFLKATVKASPRDSRFAILLGQVDTTFGDLPGALAAYDQAIMVRKDLIDVYGARAALELRLASLQAAPTQPALLDRAAADFARMYTLSYQDPKYQARVAEVRARQGRPAEAVRALETAYVTGRPTTGPVAAEDAFRVAAKLESWNLLPEARLWADRGVALAGPNLLLAQPSAADAEDGTTATAIAGLGAVVYARLVTRQGQPDVALRALVSAYGSAVSPASLAAAVKASLSSDASGGDDLKGLRERIEQQRKDAATRSLHEAVSALGAAAGRYLPPEGIERFAASLDALHGTNPDVALRAATATPGLAHREAAWRAQALLLRTQGEPQDGEALAAYASLQQSRLRFVELGRTLEAYAARVKPEERAGLRRTAAQSYRDGGDVPDELRVTRSLAMGDDPGLRNRFFDLLLRHDPAALAVLAAGNDTTLADAAVNYTLAHGTEAQTDAAVNARGRTLPAVWRPASLALTGLYFAGPAAAGSSARAPARAVPTLAAFKEALGADRTIANRLQTPAEPDRQLVGATWFPYAAGYGLFLTRVNASRPVEAPSALAAGDFLPAELELAPSDPTAYAQLAQTYAEVGDTAAALAQYAHVFELAPTGAAALSAYDDQAVLLFGAGQREKAVASWRAGLDLIREMSAHNSYPERFFTAYGEILRHAAERHVDLTPEAESILRPYVAHNGNYRANELLRPAYEDAATPAAGAALLVSVASSASIPSLILQTLEHADWLSLDTREMLLKRQMAVLASTPGMLSEGYDASIRGSTETQLLTLYLEHNQLAEAQALLDGLPQTLNTPASVDRIVVGVRAGRLAPLLARWRSSPDSAPPQADLDGALQSLRQRTPFYTPDAAAIRPLVEYDFARKQGAGTLGPTDFLTLARSRLDTGDVAGALDILHRLTLAPMSSAQRSPLLLQSDPPTGLFGDGRGGMDGVAATADPNLTLDDAARLLESTHHAAEAVPFLEALTAAVPWNASYRLRLAEARDAAGVNMAGVAAALTSVAQSASAPYATRLEAARGLASLARGPEAQRLPSGPLPDLGSAELDLLARGDPTPGQARQAAFVAARLAVASAPATSRSDRVTLLHEALAADPTNPQALKLRVQLLLAEAGSSGGVETNGAVSASSVADSVPDEPGLIRLLRNGMLGSMLGASDGLDQGAEDGAAQASGQTSLSEPFNSIDDPTTRIRVAEIFSVHAERAEGDLPQAVSDLKLAVRLAALSPHPDSVVAERLTARLQLLEARVQLARRNQARQPVFKAELAQPNVVRPRLSLAQASPFQTPSSPRSSVQMHAQGEGAP